MSELNNRNVEIPKPPPPEIPKAARPAEASEHMRPQRIRPDGPPATEARWAQPQDQRARPVETPRLAAPGWLPADRLAHHERQTAVMRQEAAERQPEMPQPGRPDGRSDGRSEAPQHMRTEHTRSAEEAQPERIPKAARPAEAEENTSTR